MYTFLFRPIALTIAGCASASTLAIAGSMAVIAATPPCTIDGVAVPAQQAQENPEACDEGTGPLAGGDVPATGEGDGTDETPPEGSGGGDTPADPVEPAPEEPTTGDPVVEDPPVVDPAPVTPEPTAADPAPAAPAAPASEPAHDEADDSAPHSDSDNAPKQGADEPAAQDEAQDNSQENAEADPAPKVFETVPFQDARTFRMSFTPKGRIPEPRTIDQETVDNLVAGAQAGGSDWPLVAALAWLDTRWGDGAAGAFVGTRLSDADWTAFGTDGDGDNQVDRASVADGSATVAAMLAAARADGTLKATLTDYFGGRESHMRRALYLAAFYDALGADALVDGLADLDVQEEIAGRVLADKRVDLYDGGIADVDDHLIDPRVLVALEFIANRHRSVKVCSLVSGHGVFTSSGNVSLHAFGQAVDICAVDDTNILGHQERGSITVKVLKDLLRMPKSMQPAELISLWDLGGPSFAMGDHHDHIHLGFTTEDHDEASGH
jgi:hypothetical protein